MVQKWNWRQFDLENLCFVFPAVLREFFDSFLLVFSLGLRLTCFNGLLVLLFQHKKSMSLN